MLCKAGADEEVPNFEDIFKDDDDEDEEDEVIVFEHRYEVYFHRSNLHTCNIA